jgi:hypothetical protein
MLIARQVPRLARTLNALRPNLFPLCFSTMLGLSLPDGIIPSPCWCRGAGYTDKRGVGGVQAWL